RGDACGESALLVEARALLPAVHARRVGRARSLPRPGPRSVRRLLRPHADPALLPDRDVGPRAGPRESDAQARDLHARRLAADARGGDRHGRAGLPTGGWPHLIRPLDASVAAAEQRLAGLDLPVLRRRVPGEDAGVSAARMDAGRVPCDADRGADGLLGRALEGGRIRLP